MADLNERVLDQAAHRGDTLLVDDLVGLIERHEDDPTPGIRPERVEAYAEALAERDAPIDPTKTRTAIEERIAETDTAPSGLQHSGSGALYEVGDGRVSAFPEDWHDELAGTSDLEAILEYALTGKTEVDADSSGASDEGIPKDVLVHAATVVGDAGWEEAENELESLRADGAVEVFPDQHPNATVRFDDERRRE